eukprot:TRINITY_DN97440_c0_g1_i1.p1 TRINITY_DN97440_c0_g1~~TRINITY_DN97440_c0_g1_i1.p1  ORF type:complete len:356 (-),score=61.99 TRINITY_DN97440_c0_g1_i1:77-1093(-)
MYMQSASSSSLPQGGNLRNIQVAHPRQPSFSAISLHDVRQASFVGQWQQQSVEMQRVRGFQQPRATPNTHIVVRSGTGQAWLPIRSAKVLYPSRSFTHGVAAAADNQCLAPNAVTGYDTFLETRSSVSASDPELQKVKELCRESGLEDVPVAEGLATFMQAAGGEQLSKGQFLDSYDSLLQARSSKLPTEDLRERLFNMFDRDGNGVVDLMELVCGVALLCGGSEDEKIEAVFQAFDENNDGFISMNEMFTFMTSVFRVGLTPHILTIINSMGAKVLSPEELASLTTLECFRDSDLNQDGKLSVTEFKNWFFAPEHDPAMFFSPLRARATNRAISVQS